MISAEDKIGSPKFENLNNHIILKTVGQFATVADAARNTGEDLEEFLHFLNENI